MKNISYKINESKEVLQNARVLAVANTTYTESFIL